MMVEAHEAIFGVMLGSPIALPLDAALPLMVLLLAWVEARPGTHAGSHIL
jgi:hypothetical protein